MKKMKINGNGWKLVKINDKWWKSEEKWWKLVDSRRDWWKLSVTFDELAEIGENLVYLEKIGVGQEGKIV